jgi:hypothetical protein
MLNLCGFVAAILKMVTGRNFSMSRINSGHHNLPTYEMSLKSDNVEHFQNGHHNSAQIQHCSISKVAFDLFMDILSAVGLLSTYIFLLRICHNAKCSFKPVVSGRFGRLHNR